MLSPLHRVQLGVHADDSVRNSFKLQVHHDLNLNLVDCDLTIV